MTSYQYGYDQGCRDTEHRIKSWLRSERSILWLLGNNGLLSSTGKDLADAIEHGEHLRGCEGCGAGPDDECESGCPA